MVGGGGYFCTTAISLNAFITPHFFCKNAVTYFFALTKKPQARHSELIIPKCRGGGGTIMKYFGIFFLVIAS